MPISSIQATIAKLSIRPPSGGSDGQPSEPPSAPAVDDASYTVAPPHPVAAEYGRSGSLELAPPLSPPATPAPRPEPPGPSAVENSSSSHVEDEGEEEQESLKPLRGLEPTAASVAPSSSSLELLASLTPEAFTLDSALKGRHRMSKQSFLQPQNGEGLRGTRPSDDDDPLSMLDPLWTLNKA